MKKCNVTRKGKLITLQLKNSVQVIQFYFMIKSNKIQGIASKIHKTLKGTPHAKLEQDIITKGDKMLIRMKTEEDAEELCEKVLKPIIVPAFQKRR